MKGMSSLIDTARSFHAIGSRASARPFRKMNLQKLAVEFGHIQSLNIDTEVAEGV
jgi:hypothetical protein